MLAASGVIEPRLVEGVVLLGELSLDGSIQPIRGVLPVAVAARREGKTAILLPRANAPEASVVEGLKVLPVDSLVEAVEALNGGGWPEGQHYEQARMQRSVARRPSASAAAAASVGDPNPISPTSSARAWPSARSKSPRQAATTCC